jgi:PAS domain S-box-containing protein
MSVSNSLLQLSFDRREATAILNAFAGLGSRIGVALLDPHARPFASAGHWPGESLAEALAAAREAPRADGGQAPGIHFHPVAVESRVVGTLAVRFEAPNDAGALADALRESLTVLVSKAHEAREVAREALAGYRELNLLYRVTDRIAASLDPHAIPQLMLEEAHHIIKADAGLVTLGDVAASFGDEREVTALHEALQPVIDELWQRNRAAILSDLPGFPSTWSTLLWAPLRTTERVLGGVALGRRAGQPAFTANDEKILTALAGPSALALQNAHLFIDLRHTLDRTREMKALMDGVVASIASGVLTTDAHAQITLCNQVAARILGISRDQAVGRPVGHVLPPSLSRLAALIGATVQRGTVTLNQYLTAAVPDRGHLHLYVSCTPLVDGQSGTTGAAVVINDMTDQRKVEAERERIRETFGRVVAPRVRDRLLAAPANLSLDGSRHTVTVLFADLHDFTRFCERMPPETAFKVLNSYLSLAAEAVMAEEGTLDKFIGDAVMGFWNAPDAQADHALRAVRAALAIARAVSQHRATLREDERLEFSIGIHTGEAIVGNVGTNELFNYTIIGDTVNLAQRVESLADPGSILLSEATWGLVSGQVVANGNREVRVKGREQPVVVYRLAGLTT